MVIRISSYILEAVGVFIILVEELFSDKTVKSLFIAREAKLDDMISSIKNDLLFVESENIYVTYDAANLLGLDKNKINLISSDEAKRCFNVVRKVKNAKNKQGWKNVIDKPGVRVYRNEHELVIPKYAIYTDGAWNRFNKKGGWAYIILKNGTIVRKHKGHELNTTSNRMELRAAIEALKVVKRNARVTIYSDSKYLVNTMTKGWRKNCNKDLWKELDSVAKDKKVKWKWVKGHNGNEYNEMVDAMAKEARLNKLDIYIDSRYGKKIYSVYKGNRRIERVEEKVTDIISIEKTSEIVRQTFQEVFEKYKKDNVDIHSSNLALDKMVKETGLPNNVKFNLVNYGTILEKA